MFRNRLKKIVLFLAVAITIFGLIVIFLSIQKNAGFSGKDQQIGKKQFKIILLGDSMTQYLGPTGDEIINQLKKKYPDYKIDIQNYGFGSTNILSAKDRLNIETEFEGIKYSPILITDVNLILIESFGHNPLSQYKLEEGLSLQNQALTEIVKEIKSKKPQVKIVFVATISPVKNRYGEGAVNLTPEARRSWAEERIAYIKNHIEYAKKNSIPLLNIYEKSLTQNGDGNIDLVNTSDFIHPSTTGIIFISKEIANFISEQKLIE